MKASEAYKNKHGLHKKPPTQTPQKLQVELMQDEDEVSTSTTYKQYYESIKSNKAPRISVMRNNDDVENTEPNKRRRANAKKV